MDIITKLFVGCNDQDTKKQEKSCAEIEELIQGILELNGFNAYTLQNASGVFTHADGVVVNEKTYIITLINVNDKLDLQLTIGNLKVALNQEAIMLEQYQSNVEFI